MLLLLLLLLMRWLQNRHQVFHRNVRFRAPKKPVCYKNYYLPKTVSNDFDQIFA